MLDKWISSVRGWVSYHKDNMVHLKQLSSFITTLNKLALKPCQNICTNRQEQGNQVFDIFKISEKLEEILKIYFH